MRSSQKTWGIWFRAWRSCCWAVEKQLASWWSQSLPPNFKKRQPSNPSNLFFLSIVQLGVSKIDLQGSQKSETLFAACKVWPSGCSGHWPEITLPTKSKELREKNGACLDSYCSIVRWLCIVRFCLLKLKWEIPVFFSALNQCCSLPRPNSILLGRRTQRAGRNLHQPFANTSNTKNKSNIY